jgi:hypothetical protein
MVIVEKVLINISDGTDIKPLSKICMIHLDEFSLECVYGVGLSVGQAVYVSLTFC